MLKAFYNKKSLTDTKIRKSELNDASEYGFGFWLRSMRRYPTPIFSQEQAWYFVARLTRNEKYGNVQFGDRVLALWQSDDRYLFATNDLTTKDANMNGQIEVGELEGVWVYVYFSYKQG